MNQLEKTIITDINNHKDLRGLSYLFSTDILKARTYMANLDHPLIIKNTIIRHAYLDAIFGCTAGEKFAQLKNLREQFDLVKEVGEEKVEEKVQIALGNDTSKRINYAIALLESAIKLFDKNTKLWTSVQQK